MIVNIRQLNEALALIDMINSVPLEDIRWNIPNAGDVPVSKNMIEEWKYVGLTNVYFYKDVIRPVLEGKVWN